MKHTSDNSRCTALDLFWLFKLLVCWLQLTGVLKFPTSAVSTINMHCHCIDLTNSKIVQMLHNLADCHSDRVACWVRQLQSAFERAVRKKCASLAIPINQFNPPIRRARAPPVAANLPFTIFKARSVWSISQSGTYSGPAICPISCYLCLFLLWFTVWRLGCAGHRAYQLAASGCFPEAENQMLSFCHLTLDSFRRNPAR